MKSRIVVIEDNPDNLELITYLLSKRGYVTLSAQDGVEGLALVRKEKPDLIICDIDLPKMNGYEIAQQLKSDPEFNLIPLLAVTAYSMIGDREKILEKGFNGYISKPIESEDFVNKVEEFMASYKQT